MSRKLPLGMLGLATLLALSLGAQEPPAGPAPEAGPAPVAESAPAPEAEAEEAEEDFPAPRGPEERVSADNNLSFPVDI